MSESAYDITHLLEAELAKFNASPVRPEKAPPSSVAPEPDVAAKQAAIARELLNVDGAHEELIRQYIQISRQLS